MAVSNKKPTISYRSWDELPLELTEDILHRLDAIEMLEIADKVCKTWRKICHNPVLWRVILIKKPTGEESKKYDVICRRAVSLSQGQVYDLSIKDFANDNLLEYISERAGALTRLKITSYNAKYACVMSARCLRKTVEQFPYLRELHLFMLHHTLFNDKVCGEDIEVFGSCCPLLTSFTLDSAYFMESEKEYGNECAKAVAKSMPDLRRLQLCGISMTNSGLRAIVDGCSLLELLDIRECNLVRKKGKVWKRCTQQIKEVRYTP